MTTPHAYDAIGFPTSDPLKARTILVLHDGVYRIAQRDALAPDDAPDPRWDSVFVNETAALSIARAIAAAQGYKLIADNSGR